MRIRWYVATFWILVCLATRLGHAQVPAAPEQLVQKAFEAELTGDNMRRQSLLNQAIANDPNFAPARWQDAQIKDGEHWISVAHMQHRAAADPVRREYLQRRASVGPTIGEQTALARWCAKQGLTVEERLHWLAVLRIEPRNAEALRTLDAQWFNGELLLADEAKRRQAEEERLKALAPKRATEFASWRKAILQGTQEEKAAALESLRAFREWEMIPALEKELSVTDESLALEVVRLLRQNPEQATTLSLLRHAVLSQWESVRTAAAESLQERPWHGFVPLLLDGLENPVRLSVIVDERPGGRVAYHQRLTQEGPFADRWLLSTQVRRATTSVAASNRFGAVVAPVSYARIVANAAERTRREVEAYNSQTAEINRRIDRALSLATGEEGNKTPENWWAWWNESQELHTPHEKPIVMRWTAREWIDPRQIRVRLNPFGGISCFPKGTFVWALTGLAPIESIQAGDRVLAQNVNTGELAFQPVLGVTLRPASPTLRLKLNSDELLTTPGHPLWRVGDGWRMAKEVKASERLHTLQGAVEVMAVEEAFESEAYNLVVADDHNYFVGKAGVLAHDVTMRQPTAATLPGYVPH